MKKTWLVFWILTALGAVIIIMGAEFMIRQFGVPYFVCALLGVVGWTVFYAHFRSIEYTVEKDRIIINSGFLIRSKKIIQKTSILWKSTVKFGSATLFSVIHTASGHIMVFALLN